MGTVLITGANRGLGLEFARQYAMEGWQVLATARSPSAELAALASAGVKGAVRVFKLDVHDPDAVAQLAANLQDEVVDVLINNAGYFGGVAFSREGIESQRFGAIDYGDWERTLRINVLAPMRMTEAFIEHVARSPSGRVVTLTSMLGSAGLNSTGGLYSYRTSKAAVNMLMKSLSIDLAKRGVLAVALHPGWVKTDMGGPGADIDATASVRGMRAVITGLTPAKLGRVYAYDGQELPY